MIWKDAALRPHVAGTLECAFPNQLGLSASKRIPIREQISAEFRWELFNVTNTPVFRNPASTLAAGGPGTAGVITETIGVPRTMKAALRLRF